MTSLDPGTGPTPGENRAIDTPPISKGRRTVRFTARADADARPDEHPQVEAAIPAPRSGRGLALPTSRDDWLVLAERAVGDWASTLRSALLILLVVAGAIMAVGIVFGAAAALASAGIVLLVYLVGRQRDGGPPTR
ncbi:MAG TPA: hypothetical protein VNP92_27380 [Actinophytocola sp.]|nr:hypothetical protein [Actinophytocola sp.]